MRGIAIVVALAASTGAATAFLPASPAIARAAPAHYAGGEDREQDAEKSFRWEGFYGFTDKNGFKHHGRSFGYVRAASRAEAMEFASAKLLDVASSYARIYGVEVSRHKVTEINER